MSKKIKIVGLVVMTILGLLVASMYVTSEMKWDFADFVLAGILLFGAGVAGILIWERIALRRWRIILLAVLAFIFILIWAELAVGLIGSPFAGN